MPEEIIFDELKDRDYNLYFIEKGKVEIKLSS